MHWPWSVVLRRLPRLRSLHFAIWSNNSHHDVNEFAFGRRTTSSSTSSRQLSLASLNSRPDRFVRMSWTNVVGSSALYYLSHSRDIMHFAAWSTVEGILFRSALLPLRIAEKFECELFSLSSFHLQACLMKEPARRAGGVNSYTTNQSVLAIL